VLTCSPALWELIDQRMKAIAGVIAFVVPGFSSSLGVMMPGSTPRRHHTPTFQADDPAIPVRIKAMTTLVLDYLRTGAPAQ
jgi:metal-dependent amidase/aminoacylase/carboxypeptidase family protein